MEATALTSKINIASINSFAANFFQFARYLNARLEAAFGSAIDPITGAIDTAEYVPVSYINRVDGREIDIARVCDLLLEGKNIVLLGEYGSGKSRCIRQIFSLLAVDWGITFKFPFAINLRECWGLKSGKEILRRSLLELGLDELEASAVRVFNTKNCILLIDGFDEVGSQSWSVDEDRLRQLRAQAVSGVKDAIRSVGGGCLIAGREHYFSSEAEMFSALGLDKKNTIVLQAKDEFTEEEMESYFELTGVNVDLPSWLPRRPLICQTIATLTDDELERMFGIDNQDAEFWNHFINVLCERDARINANFDAGTIYQVFLKLSRRTRNLPANVGPISQRTLQEAFEEVVGKLPVEEAAVMLLRLPSLGRIGLESSDRQFVDTFILDGLRARDIIGAIEADNETRREIAADSWMNPLEPLGQSVLALEIDRRFESFRQLAEQASRSENKTLCGDIIAAAARSELESTFDFNGLAVSGASFSDLDLHRLNVQNFEIENAVVQVLVLPSSPPSNVRIKNSLVEKVSGASSFSGLPSWVSLSSVDRFDSVQTVAEIRRAGLSPAHEVLVSILKKTFMQKGAGRKEAALYRGFGAGSVKTIAQEVLPFLMKEGVLSRHRGNEGWIYSPERSQAARVGKILDQLRSSDDPLWKATDAFN
nr:NACHT domain-containing protein [Novosphingobium fluoreni]